MIFGDIKVFIAINFKSSLLRLRVMAGSKEATDRPSYHAVGKEDIVAVDRKTFRSDVWEHFGWHRKAIGSSWVVCNRCCAWVSRKGNNTSNMRRHLKSVTSP